MTTDTAQQTGTDLAFSPSDLADRHDDTAGTGPAVGEPLAMSPGGSSQAIRQATRGHTGLPDNARVTVATQALVGSGQESDRLDTPDRQRMGGMDTDTTTTDRRPHRPTGRPSLDGTPGETKQRGVRIPDDEWYAAVAQAKAEGTNISAVIRTLLRDWREAAGRVGEDDETFESKYLPKRP